MTGERMHETPDTLRQLRGELRSFLDGWRRDPGFVPAVDSWLRGYDPAFSQALGAAGWLGLTWPRCFGGRGRSYLARVVVTEELLRAGAPVAAHWIADRQIGPTISRFGPVALKEEFLPRIAAGRATFCLALSEPDAGSDLAALRTRAVRASGGWRLTGEKIWSSHAHRSAYAYVLARTSTGPNKHEGLSEFIVDMDSAGLQTQPIEDMNGEHHFCSITFNDVLVPDDRVIGEVGRGWQQATEQLSFERGGPERVLSTYVLFDAAVAALRERGESNHVALLGGFAARAMALRRMVWDVARRMDAGLAPVREAAVMKHLGTMFERDLVEAGRSLVADISCEDSTRLNRLVEEGTMASPAFTIRGGTTEVLLTIIAQSELQ